MTETDVAKELPLMVRISITRDELDALKIEAIREKTNVQDLLAAMVRERLAA
jgi:hypothetical protein